jgi:hypothetical protein
MAMFGGGADAAGGIDDAMGKMDQLKASMRSVAGTALCSTTGLSAQILR